MKIDWNVKKVVLLICYHFTVSKTTPFLLFFITLKVLTSGVRTNPNVFYFYCSFSENKFLGNINALIFT